MIGSRRQQQAMSRTERSTATDVRSVPKTVIALGLGQRGSRHSPLVLIGRANVPQPRYRWVFGGHRSRDGRGAGCYRLRMTVGSRLMITEAERRFPVRMRVA